MSDTAQLEEFLAPYPDHVVKTMLEGRTVLLEMLSPVVELQFDATSAVCDGFSYLPSVRGSFVNFAAYANHVTLVFGYGVGLSDPEGRLNGNGNQVRHIRLKDAQDLQDPYIVGLIQQASDAAVRPQGEVVPDLIVKVYEGPKRRPKT
jgi:hypothetical protein